MLRLIGGVCTTLRVSCCVPMTVGECVVSSPRESLSVLCSGCLLVSNVSRCVVDMVAPVSAIQSGGVVFA